MAGSPYPEPQRTSPLLGLLMVLWALSILCSFGALTGPTFIFAGSVCRKTWWVISGIVYTIAFLSAFALVGITAPDEEIANENDELFTEELFWSDVGVIIMFAILLAGLLQCAFMIPVLLRWYAGRSTPTIHQSAVAAPPSPQTHASSSLSVPESVVPASPDLWPPGSPTFEDDRPDLNTAPRAQIAGLPEVGGSVAVTITSERELNGPYLSLDDLIARTRLPPHTIMAVTAASVIRPPEWPQPTKHRLIDD